MYTTVQVLPIYWYFVSIQNTSMYIYVLIIYYLRIYYVGQMICKYLLPCPTNIIFMKILLRIAFFIRWRSIGDCRSRWWRIKKRRMAMLFYCSVKDARWKYFPSEIKINGPLVMNKFWFRILLAGVSSFYWKWTKSLRK